MFTAIIDGRGDEELPKVKGDPAGRDEDALKGRISPHAARRPWGTATVYARTR